MTNNNPVRDMFLAALLDIMGPEVAEIIDRCDRDLAYETVKTIEDLSSIVEIQGVNRYEARKLMLYVILSEIYRTEIGNLHPAVANQLKSHAEKNFN